MKIYCFQEQNKVHPVQPQPNANHSSSDIQPLPSAPDLLDQVMYPNDFPTGPGRSNLPSSGLLLPDSNRTLPQRWAFL